MKIVLNHKPNETVANMIHTMSQTKDRHTMTRGDFHQWFQAQRNANPTKQDAIEINPDAPLSPAYLEKLDFRAQIEEEIATKRNSILHAKQALFKHREDRLLDDSAPTSGSMHVSPPQLEINMDQFPDKETPKTKEAIRRLNSIPERLRERLDAQLAPLMPKLRRLDEE